MRRRPSSPPSGRGQGQAPLNTVRPPPRLAVRVVMIAIIVVLSLTPLGLIMYFTSPSPSNPAVNADADAAAAAAVYPVPTPEPTDKFEDIQAALAGAGVGTGGLRTGGSPLLQPLSDPSASLVRGPRPADPSPAFAEAVARFVRLQNCILDPACDEVPKRYVVVESTGGLGNQLSAIISGVLVAMLTDAAVLFEMNLGGGAAPFDVLFDPEMSVSTSANRWSIPKAIRRTKHVYDIGWTLRHKKGGAILDLLACGDLATDLTPMAILYSNQWFADMVLLNPHYQDTFTAWFGPSREVFHNVFWHVLRPSDTITTSLEMALEETPAATTRVGVHLRMRHTDAAVLPAQVPLFLDCAREMGGPGAVIMVATDSQSMREALEMQDAPDVVVMPDVPGESDFAAQALVEMLWVASADKLVMSSWSSYSYSAFSVSRSVMEAAIVTAEATSDAAFRPYPSPESKPSPSKSPLPRRARIDSKDREPPETHEFLRYHGVPFLSNDRTACVALDMAVTPVPCFHHLGYVDLHAKLSCLPHDTLVDVFDRYC